MSGLINFGLMNPNLPQQIGNSFAQGQQQAQQRAMSQEQLNVARRQNRLAELAMQDEEATREAYRSSGGDLGKVVTSLQRGGQYKAAMGLQSQMSAQQKEKITQAIEGTKLIKSLAGSVFANPTQDSAIAALQQFQQVTGQDQSAKIAEVQSFAGDPARIKQWASGHAIEADKMLPKLTNMNLGGTERLMTRDPISGKVIEQTDIARTQTPDSVASNETRVSEGRMNRAAQRESANKPPAQPMAPVAYVDPVTKQVIWGTINEAKGKPAANYNPEAKAGVAQAVARGKEAGEADASLTVNASLFPQVEKTVADLKELGKTATYTLAGRARDEVVRQSGAGATKGAVAREKYVQTVRDMLFPQLRATFGAQFTVREGEALIATLGDPNKSPEEKNAALDAFIDQKRETIKSLERQTGKPNATAGGAYADPAKEKRYQEWLKSQGR